MTPKSERCRLHGSLQRQIVAKARKHPQVSFPLPPTGTDRDAVRRLADKGWLVLEEAGSRWRYRR